MRKWIGGFIIGTSVGMIVGQSLYKLGAGITLTQRDGFAAGVVAAIALWCASIAANKS